MNTVTTSEKERWLAFKQIDLMTVEKERVQWPLWPLIEQLVLYEDKHKYISECFATFKYQH